MLALHHQLLANEHYVYEAWLCSGTYTSYSQSQPGLRVLCRVGCEKRVFWAHLSTVTIRAMLHPTSDAGTRTSIVWMAQIEPVHPHLDGQMHHSSASPRSDALLTSGAAIQPGFLTSSSTHLRRDYASPWLCAGWVMDTCAVVRTSPEEMWMNGSSRRACARNQTAQLCSSRSASRSARLW